MALRTHFKLIHDLIFQRELAHVARTPYLEEKRKQVCR